jgi:hypothetical protein
MNIKSDTKTISTFDRFANYITHVGLSKVTIYVIIATLAIGSYFVWYNISAMVSLWMMVLGTILWATRDDELPLVAQFMFSLPFAFTV